MDGFRTIEALRVGDMVLSRDENDLLGEVSAKMVEEVFVRNAAIWIVVMGGEEVRTTGEHPFYVEGKGWLAVHEMSVGDRVLCLDGSSVEVEKIEETGDWEQVYNVRIADWHTYFVGTQEWGFAAWAHNRYINELEGHARATVIRDQFEGLSVSKRRTVAYAELELNIPGLPQEVVGVSGELPSQGIIDRWNRINPQSVVALPAPHELGAHADAAVIQHIRTLLHNNPTAKGVISMYIDHPLGRVNPLGGACDPCTRIILEFRREFQGRIQLDILANAPVED